MVITTHFDSDHVGGVPSILESMRVGTLMDNGRTEPYFKRYNQLRKKHQKKYIKAESGQVFNIDKDTTLTILHPIKGMDYDKKKNNNSIAGIIRYKNTSFLFTGDLEEEREYLLTQVYGHHLDVDLYKAGHHGSKTSSKKLAP